MRQYCAQRQNYLKIISNIYVNYKIMPSFVKYKFRLYGNLLFLSIHLFL